MKLLDVKLVAAVQGGDLKYLRSVFEVCSKDEVKQLLATRQQDSVLIRRPTTGRELYVRQPSLMAVAVSSWYGDILEYLASFEVCLDDDFTVDDCTNSPACYGGATALHLAAIAGKLNMVQSLVRHGATLNRKTALGDTALFEACFEGHRSIVQFLVENEADIEICNERGTNCLMISAYADNSGIIKYIINQGADINQRDADGRNVLFYAVAAGRLDTLVFLLDSGVQPTADHQRVNVLMEATLQGHLELITYLTNYNTLLHFDLNDLDEVGRNVLFYSVDQKTTDILDLLLNCGVLIDPANDGRTLLMAAALKNNMTFIKYLAQNADKLGLDIRETDAKGRNCLFYCITGANIEVFEYILEAGVPVRPSSEGVTLIMQAVAKNKPEFLTYLLMHKDKYGLSVDPQDRDGWDAMLYAVASGNLQLFKQLMTCGTHCHLANDGRTIVMQAAAKGDVAFLRHILDNSGQLLVYVHQRDNDGWNALFYTVQGGHLEAFKFLIKRGGKVCAALNGVTLLMEAVDKSQLDFVEYLLQAAGTLGLDINEKDHEGNNVLFYAMATGHLTLFERLLTAGCDVESDYNNRTLLMQAALHGHARAVKYIVENSQSLGIDIHQKDKDGRNALFYCTEGGHLEILRYLLEVGIQCAPDNTGKTNLMQAARAGNMRVMQYLLDNSICLNVDINSKDENDENALFYAVRSRSMEVVNALLQANIEIVSNKQGVNVLSQSLCDARHDVVDAILSSDVNFAQVVNGKDIKGRSVLFHYVDRGNLDMLSKLGQYYDRETDHDVRGVTLLMRAAMFATHLPIMQYLVETLKVDVGAVDVKQRTALFYAVEAGNACGVTYLLQHLPTVRADENGVTVLMLAASFDSKPILEELLNSKAGKHLLHSQDNWEQSALHYCALQGRDSVVGLLHAQGCSMDSQDTDGITPVMCACAQGHVATLNALLRCGASAELVDNKRKNALHYCLGRNPSLRCVRALLQYGVEINQADNRGVTPLMLACHTCSRTNIAIIKLLLDWGADPIMQDNDGKDSSDHCPFDASYVKAMLQDQAEIDSGQKKALLKYKPQMTTSLQLNSVLRGLLRRQIFTKTLNFEVMKTPATDRVTRMLELLSMRGESAFRSFCEVLKDECEVELAYGLMKEAYRKQDEIYW